MSEQEEADRRVAEWAKDKPHFKKVRQRMGEIIQTDMDLLKSGRMGLGTVKDGNLDLDHAYDLATRMHPETLAEMRAAKKREQQSEQSTRPPRQKQSGEPESARSTIMRSLKELRERG